MVVKRLVFGRHSSIIGEEVERSNLHGFFVVSSIKTIIIVTLEELDKSITL